MEKLTKLVSTSMWYGGPSCVLYWKNRADEVCGLQQKWDTKLLHRLFCTRQQFIPTGECSHEINIYNRFINHVPNLLNKMINMAHLVIYIYKVLHVFNL